MRRSSYLYAIFGALILAALVFAPAVTQAQEQRYRATTWTTQVDVLPGGNLVITETFDVAFTGGTFSFLFRDLFGEDVDGLRDIQAATPLRLPDETPLEGASVTIEGEDEVRIEWNLPDIRDVTLRFELSYTAVNALAQTNEADLLRWALLSDEYEWPIDDFTATLDYPSSVSFAGAASLLSGDATTTVGTETDSSAIQLSAQNLEPGTPLVIEVPFAPGSLVTTTPEWQLRDERGEAIAPLWIAAGLIVPLLTLIFAVRYRSRFLPGTDKKKSGEPRTEQPEDTPPAVAGVLASRSTTVQWHHAFGTMFDLARRGFIQLREETESTTFGKKQIFHIERDAAPHDLRPHEQALDKLLFWDKRGNQRQSIQADQLGSNMQGHAWKEFTEAIKAEIEAAGLLDEERQKAPRLLYGIGTVLLFVPIIFLIVFVVGLQASFNAATVLGTIGLSIAPLIAFSTAWSIPPLSNAGYQQAARWQSFFKYLEGLTKQDPNTLDENTFARFLPYAAAGGHLEKWAKHFEDVPNLVTPDYLHGNAGGFVASIVVFSSMTSSSMGGVAAGAGAGGAAGGAGGGGAG